MKRRFLSCLGIVFFLFLFIPIQVVAISNPDYVSIGDVYVFEDVLATGDVLVYVREDVSYPVQPDEDSEDTFLMAIYDTDGTTLIAARSLNYYQHNIISIYLAPSDNVLVSGSAYYVRIMGSPALFELVENVNMDTRVLTAGDYYDLTDLGGIMITQAGILEDDWGIDLLTANEKLNSTGSYYFLKAIPGLSTMVPLIFATSTGGFTYTRDNQATTGLNITNNQTPVSLTNAFAGIAAILGIESTSFSEFGSGLFMALIVGAVLYAATRRPDVAVLGGVIGTMGFEAYLGVADGNMMLALMAVGTVIIVLFAVEFILPRYG